MIESGALPRGRRAAHRQGLKLVEAALAKQEAGNGNRLGRNPSAHLAALWCLAGLRATLEEGGHPASPAVSEAIGRIASALHLLRHGDGGLALFNGGVEEERGLIDLALSRAAASDSSAPHDAPDTGFSRIESRHTTLIADTGAPAAAGRWAHAGTLSLELSAGRERLVVNCGGWRGSDDGWLEALRATAAHSTLVVDDTNSATLGSDGTIADGPNAVKVERRERTARPGSTPATTATSTASACFTNAGSTWAPRAATCAARIAHARENAAAARARIRGALPPAPRRALRDDRGPARGAAAAPQRRDVADARRRRLHEHRRERLRRRRREAAAHLPDRVDGGRSRTRSRSNGRSSSCPRAADRLVVAKPCARNPLQYGRQWTNKGPVGCT